MNFNPPNLEFFNDTLIFSGVECTTRHRQRKLDNFGEQRIPASTMGATSESLQSCQHVNAQPQEVEDDTTQTKLSLSNDLVATLSLVAGARAELRRLRGCLNQRRYRKKQSDKVSGLKRDITQLLEEIDMCHIRISNRWSSIMVNPTPWSVVAEYYRLVSRGVDDSPPTSPDRCSNPTNHVKYPVSVVQRFFQTMLMPDVTSVGGVGVEAHVAEWKNISAIYPDFDMRIVRIEEGPSGELVVASKTILTFSEDTFRNAYPHMLDNSNKNIITAKLWGQKLEVATVAHFVWNNTMGRIAEIMFQVDMIPPLVQVLGSLELVAFLFSYAFLTPEGHVVVA